MTKTIESALLINIALNDYSLMDNSELLKRRLKALKDSRDQLQESTNQQVAYNRTLERETCRLKSETGQLARQRDRYALYVFCFKGFKYFFSLFIEKLSNLFAFSFKCRWLKKNGMKQNKMDFAVHSDEKTWLYLQGSRPDADHILKGRPDGTFLVRRSRTGQYALSIV